jgi:S1-C subfamily serine protease
VNLTVFRDGREQKLNVKLGELNPKSDQSRPDSGQPSDAQGDRRFGLSVEPLTPDRAGELGIRRGTQGLVVTAVEPDSSAAEAGVRPGDVIVEANRQPVRSANDLRQALQRSGSKPALLLVNREGQTVYLTLRAP